MKDDEFFVGWMPNQPEQTGKAVSVFSLGLLLVALVVAGTAVLQATFDKAVYDYANPVPVEGVLVTQPFPRVVVDIPGTGEQRSYLLVGELKEGWTAEMCGEFAGKPVVVDGGPIFRGDATMLEATPAKLSAPSAPTETITSTVVKLGEATLTGEIVDSKCYYGAMNPGKLKPHRACATVCIKGGVPPVLIARDGQSTYQVVLVGEGGEMINDDLVRFVARDLQITGQLEVDQGLLVLRTSAARIAL